MFQQSTTQEVSERQDQRSSKYVTVSNVWKTCQTGENLPLHAAARGQPKRLAEPELDLVQLLIKCRPTRTYKGINERKYQGAIHGKSFDFYNRPFCPTAYQKGK